MDARDTGPAPDELLGEVNGLLTGMGVLSVALFPFALPGLVLALALALPLVILGLPVLALLALARAARAATRALRRPARPESPERSSRHAAAPRLRPDSQPR